MTSKHLQVKRHHHHVWGKYMKRWSSNDQDVYITTRQKKIISHSVGDIAFVSDFYRVGYLKQEHIDLIKSFSSLADKELQKQHMLNLSEFILKQFLEKKYRESNIYDKEIEQIIEAMKGNGIENYHTAHENEVQHILESLANRDLSILENGENMLNFMQFYAQQFTRTKAFRDKVKMACSGANDIAGKKISKTLEESWWFLSYMFGMTVADSLYDYRKRDIHCLLINETDMPFITSDQPVINAYQKMSDEFKPPEDHECDLYFPISPKVAYMINKSNRFPRGKVVVTEDIVEEMNIRIAKSANVNIISNSEESLKPYRKYVGTWHQKVKDSLGGKA
ncbi:DUF4238 domain-containing protein [Vreelandella neptunia]|jgi:hypothetical protein|uniref:DUF4238 domain-containing protein n=1 Tax=Vreelandella neptunia TaxID=115551 RepID=A0ABS9SAJ6_9GAMM|nr:DUF4238 domain-containing protein [Halomonas neptunia]MCH4813121.1 DUF4238 domain-containing protein [Halomonas neptunia]